MKNFSKRLLALLFCTLLLVVAALPAISAEERGSDAPFSEGLGFSELGTYPVTQAYGAAPRTIEAVICVPTDMNERAGVVIGNRLSESNDAYLTLEILKNGVPSLSYRDVWGIHYEFRFETVDVRSDGWVHVSVVQDAEAKEVRCYLDGVLAEVLGSDRTEKPYSDYHADTAKNIFYLGGDGFDRNVNYFKGTLRSLALFADARTDAQIAADVTGGVSDAEPALLALYDMAGLHGYEDILDRSENGAHAECLRDWFDESIGAYRGDYDFSLAVVGDTQNFIYREAEGQPNYQGVTERLYSWIVDRVEEKRTQYVIGLGDITDNDFDSEWELAKRGITLMDGVVPYTLIRGQGHDTATKFNRYFAEHTPYTEHLGGTFKEGSVANNWQTFSYGEEKYLILGLDFGVPDDVIAWAGGIIEAHPDHRVIVTTHCYLDTDGTTMDYGEIGNATGYDDDVKYNEDPEKYVPEGRDSDMEFNDGRTTWNELISKYENVFMVISGHTQVEDVVINQRDGINGNTVTEILIDAQTMDDGQYDGGVGMVATFYFDQAAGQVAIEYYSTVQDSYRRMHIVDLDHKHEFESVVVPSTCKDKGYRAEVCACGKVTNRYTLPLNGRHTYDSDADAECNVCGKVRVVEAVTEEIPAESTPEAEATDVPETATDATERESESEISPETESPETESPETDEPEAESPETEFTEAVTDTEAPETDAESVTEISSDAETEEAPTVATGGDGEAGGGSTLFVSVGVVAASVVILVSAAAILLKRRKK